MFLYPHLSFLHVSKRAWNLIRVHASFVVYVDCLQGLLLLPTQMKRSARPLDSPRQSLQSHLHRSFCCILRYRRRTLTEMEIVFADWGFWTRTRTSLLSSSRYPQPVRISRDLTPGRERGRSNQRGLQKTKRLRCKSHRTKLR